MRPRCSQDEPSGKQDVPRWAMMAARRRQCTQCIKEDVDPTFAASHKISHCFRVKGGYCDEVGAKTREQRRQAVKDKVEMMRNEKSQKARGGNNKSTRGKGVKFSKTTQLSVKTPAGGVRL